MKKADVVIGQVYLTRISGELRRVKVLREELYPSYMGATYMGMTRIVYRLQTSDGRTLQKCRTAAALRPVPTVQPTRIDI